MIKVIKINAVWCSGCLVMNKTWKKVLDKYNIETVNLDYDFDEDDVKKYNVGDVLPVLIFYKNEKEVKRVVGEASFSQLCNIIEEVGL